MKKYLLMCLVGFACAPLPSFGSATNATTKALPHALANTKTTDKDGITTLSFRYKRSEDGYMILVDHDRRKLEMKNSVTAALLKFKNSNFGGGSRDVKNRNHVRHHPAWQEYVWNPKIRANQELSNQTNLYARLSAVWATTQGNGDGADPSLTSNKPSLFSPEEAVIGWNSGNLLQQYGYGDPVFDVSVGNQGFKVADRFVISDGTSDNGWRAASWWGPRGAFRETAIIKVNTNPIRGDIFHLRTNTSQRYVYGSDQPRTMLYGGNVEYVSRDAKQKELWNLGFTFAHLYQADSDFRTTSPRANRKGLSVYNPRLGGSFFPINRDIRFYAGYVHQRNNTPLRKANAHAYYVEPGYQFSKVWGTPVLTYRYMFFSGDNNPGSSIKKSYDPLMFGYWARSFGAWEAGEAYGQVYFTNTNQKVHTIQLKMTPWKDYTMGILYYNIKFDKPRQAGAISNRSADEWDAYVKWSPYSWLDLSAIVGACIPKSGLKQLTAAGNTAIPASRIGKTLYFGFLSATLNF